MISDAIGFEKKFRLKEDKKFEQYKIMLPKLRENDVMIKISAISISTLDTQIRQTIKGAKKPYILGFGGVGIITRLGSSNQYLNVGDRVLYVNKVGKYGSYSNFQIADVRSIVKLPDSFPTDEAAAFSYSFFLAFEVLFSQLQLTPKPKKNQGNLLILNTSDGLGATIIQLAKWAGLKVAATIDKNNSEIWIKNMGADVVVSQSTQLSKELTNAEMTPVDYVINLDTEKEKTSIICRNSRIRPRCCSCTSLIRKRKILIQTISTSIAKISWRLLLLPMKASSIPARSWSFWSIYGKKIN